MADFAYVSSRLGNVAAATRKIAEEIFYAAQAAGHEIWFMWGMGTSPEHATGRALDLMVRNEAGGDFVRDYIWANRARLRLHHVIWEQHITSTVVNPGYRRLMEDRGNATANHYDHVHTLHFAGDYQAPGASAPQPSKSVTDVAREVLRGDWGNGQDRKNRLTAAGYDYNAVQAEVNRLIVGTPAPKTVHQLADEVMRGDWGNGQDRRNRLQSAGYDYDAVQAEVNRRLGVVGVTTVARAVIRGDYGNGAERRRRLSAAGWDPDHVQREVNRLLGIR